MERKYKVSITVVAAVIITALVIGMVIHIATNFVYHDKEHILVSTTDEKMIAPDFTVFDIEREETHLSEHLGKKAVVSFWATWCRPSKSMLSDFDKIYMDNKDDVEFMMINLTDGMEETIEAAGTYVTDSEVSVPVYYDLSYDAAHAYHIDTLPVTVFIDENGYISNIHQGYLNKGQIEDYISAIGTTSEILQ